MIDRKVIGYVPHRPEIVLNLETLSYYFARLITSKHNQHAIVAVLGSGGTGKSYSGIDLATETAYEVAQIKGGHEEDYFNFDDNLAIINREEINRVMEKPGKYNIIDLDDIGVGWNARKYKDEFNIDLNDIVQTFRPNNNLLILTMQASFLVDKVPRSLMHYIIEMEAAMFDYEMAFAKVLKVNLKPRTGDIYYQYPIVNGTRYPRHIFKKPADSLMSRYEDMRGIQLQRMKDAKKQKEEQQTLKKKDVAVSVIDGIVAEFGVNIGKACQIAGISVGYYNRMKA